MSDTPDTHDTHDTDVHDVQHKCDGLVQVDLMLSEGLVRVANGVPGEHVRVLVQGPASAVVDVRAKFGETIVPSLVRPAVPALVDCYWARSKLLTVSWH